MEVRNELQRFAEDILRPQLSQFAECLQQEVLKPQLSEFAERLQRDFHEELNNCLQGTSSSRWCSLNGGSVTPPTGEPPDLRKTADETSFSTSAGDTSAVRSFKKPAYLHAPTWAVLDTDEGEDDAKTKLNAVPEKARRTSISTRSTMLGDDFSRGGGSKTSGVFFKAEQKVIPCSCRSIPMIIVSSKWFERVVAVAILLNAVYIGVQTEYMAVNELASAPLAFQVTELVFLAVFTTEISLKLFVHRCGFFACRTPTGARNDQVYWNILDCLIIGLQVIETILSPLNEDSTAFNGLSVIRILRLLRLVRIVRIVKVMRFVADLRMIIYSIWRSISLFFWSVVALVLLNFICSVYFTEFVLTNKVNGGIRNKQEINLYFGSLTTTMVSLFQAVTGGVDWGALTDVLCAETTPWIIVPFLVYVAFNSIAMLNVISGVFLETAMEIAREEKDIYVVRNARLVFTAVDYNKNGTITWEDFESALDHPNMLNFFEAVDIRPSEARTLFDLLDTSGDGRISADEFLQGCLRVRGPSKALDLLILSREVSHLFEKHLENSRILETNQMKIQCNRKAILQNRKAIKSTIFADDDVAKNSPRPSGSPRAPSPVATDNQPEPSSSRPSPLRYPGCSSVDIEGEPSPAGSLPGQCPNSEDTP